MGSESFRILGIDPFKTCSPSEADAVVEEARKKAEIRKTKGQSLLEKQNAQRDLDALPGCRRDVLDPAVAAKAREEVLSIITRDLDRYLFHRIDGSAVFFEKNIDDILEPALKKNWNVDRDAVSFIKGAKMVSEKDFKDLPSDTAFSILNSLGTDDIVAWTNSAIDALYSGDSGSVPQKVSPDTSYPTFKSAINAVAARAQKVQTNSHFKDAAKKYYPLLKKLIPMFANESSYKKFRTAAIMYSVESELQSGTSSLDYRTIASLINSRIAGKGVNTDEALRELERFCLSKGILADFSKVSREYAACGFCGCRFRIDKDTNFCPYCNKPMAVKCPRCGVRNNSSNIHCKGCGLDFSFLSDIPSLEKGLREDIRKGNMGSIKAVLPRFEGYEDFADKSLLKEAEDFVKETGDLMRDLRSMESSGKYCSALKRCEDYLRIYPGLDEFKEMRDRYAGIIADVDRKFREIPAGSESKYVELVALCSDHPGLIGYFNSHRPAPPANVSVSRSGDGNILISTGAPPPADTTYLIIRKAGSSPLSEKDGEQVAETRDAEYTDRGMSFGTEYRYAVYSRRWGVTSASAALSGPITVFADVTDASASPSGEGARLDYRVPRGCSRILIFRKEGSDPPVSGVPYADNGTKSFFTDRDVRDGSVYYYRIVPEYSGNRAVPYRTGGAAVVFKPRPPPEPVKDLSVSFSGGMFSAKFTSEEEPELYISDPSVNLGMSSCAVSDLNRSARRLGGIIKNYDGTRSFSLPPGSAGIVYAVITAGGTAIIGNGAFVSTLSDASDIRTTMDGSICSITFSWPAGCDKVRIVMKPDVYPGGFSDGEADEYILLEKYTRDGNARFKVPFQRTCARLFCVYPGGYSQGVPLALFSRTDLPEIRYSFAYSLFGRKCTCRISVPEDLGTLPAMILRGHDKSMPTKTSLGKTLEEIPEQKLRGSGLAVPVSSPSKNMKLFFADAEDNNRYRLIHPVRRHSGFPMQR